MGKTIIWSDRANADVATLCVYESNLVDDRVHEGRMSVIDGIRYLDAVVEAGADALRVAKRDAGFVSCVRTDLASVLAACAAV